MRNESFTLKSGVKLQVTIAPFEVAVALVEAVKRSTLGMDPGIDIGSAVVMSSEVRKALYAAFDTVLYGVDRVTPTLFDDPKIGEKARGDYFEICSHVIEMNSRPFFLKTSSESKDSQEAPTRSLEST